MRGGANAHMMEVDNSSYYVVKFRNNPQHSRVLVNELICYVLLDYLGLPSPGWDLIEVTPELIERTPGLTMEVGAAEVRCDPGLQFGSRFPVDPARQAVYDYVPASLLMEVVNRRTFLGMVAFDKWISNANGRQAVFFRTRAKDWIEDPDDPGAPSPRKLVYVVNMIDHGFAFNAHHWEFSSLPEQGVYTRREVYSGVSGFDDFEPWLGRIRELPAEILDDCYKRIPPEWYGDDWDALEALLEALYRRRVETADLIWKAKSAERDPFPNWRVRAASGGLP